MGLRQAGFAQATPQEALAFLRDVEPPELVRAIRDTDPADLAVVLQDAERGAAVVEGVVRRLADLAVPAQLAGVRGVLRWQTTDVPGSWTVALRDGTSDLVAQPADAAVDLDVRGSAVDLLRMVAGQLDLALGYLGGTLDLAGDSDLALAAAGLFAVDGTAPVQGRPVDPRAIDPVEVSRVLRGVSAGHLRSVMASGFRPVILEEIFERMPDFVNGRKAAGLQITVGFRLTGRHDGQVDRYVLRLRDGQATVLAGEAADAVAADVRDATVTCEAHDFLRLVTGHLGAVTGVLRGHLKVRGDKTAALRLSGAFDIPTAAAG